jgi:hypothetical protein
MAKVTLQMDQSSSRSGSPPLSFRAGGHSTKITRNNMCCKEAAAEENMQLADRGDQDVASPSLPPAPRGALIAPAKRRTKAAPWRPQTGVVRCRGIRSRTVGRLPDQSGTVGARGGTHGEPPRVLLPAGAHAQHPPRPALVGHSVRASAILSWVLSQSFCDPSSPRHY